MDFTAERARGWDGLLGLCVVLFVTKLARFFSDARRHGGRFDDVRFKCFDADETHDGFGVESADDAVRLFVVRTVIVFSSW